MYFKELSKREKHNKKRHKKLIREQKSPFAFDYFACLDSDSFSKQSKNRSTLKRHSNFNSISKDNHDCKAKRKESFDNDFYGHESLKRFNKMLDIKDIYSKLEAKQILKVVCALLLTVTANEALAWDFDAGTKAGLKPVYKWVVDWWPYFVGLIGCGMAMFGEGDLRVRSKTAGLGVAGAAVVMLILIGAMGTALQPSS